MIKPLLVSREALVVEVSEPKIALSVTASCLGNQLVACETSIHPFRGYTHT